MSIEINELEKDELYTVNGKEVYIDSDNKWIARQELTHSEQGAFSLYRAARVAEKEKAVS